MVQQFHQVSRLQTLQTNPTVSMVHIAIDNAISRNPTVY